MNVQVRRGSAPPTVELHFECDTEQQADELTNILSRQVAAEPPVVALDLQTTLAVVPGPGTAGTVTTLGAPKE